MSLPSRPVRAVSEEISRVAYTTFPHDHVHLRMPEACGAILADDEFADLFPSRGQPRQVSEVQIPGTNHALYRVSVDSFSVTQALQPRERDDVRKSCACAAVCLGTYGI
jgi:hypothetical protein